MSDATRGVAVQFARPVFRTMGPSIENLGLELNLYGRNPEAAVFLRELSALLFKHGRALNVTEAVNTLAQRADDLDTEAARRLLEADKG